MQRSRSHLGIHIELRAVKGKKKCLMAQEHSHFLVITRGNLDHLFSYAAGNAGDQKSDLALRASCPEGPEKV